MIVTFDKKIYKEQAIRTAILDYQQIAEILLKVRPLNFECKIVQSVYPIDITALEFSNYVLNQSVSIRSEDSRHEIR